MDGRMERLTVTKPKATDDISWEQPEHEGAGPVGLVESPTPEALAAADLLAATAATVRFCNEPDCGQPIAPDAHRNTKKCPDHFVGVAGKNRRGPRDKAPVINVKLPGPPKADKKNVLANDVAAGAEAMLGFIPLGFGMFGDAQCAALWKGSLPSICEQIGRLSEFHPGIAKLFAPVSNAGEGAAWFGLFMAMSPVVIATLAHHGKLPPSLMEGIAAAMGGAIVVDASTAT